METIKTFIKKFFWFIIGAIIFLLLVYGCSLIINHFTDSINRIEGKNSVLQQTILLKELSLKKLNDSIDSKEKRIALHKKRADDALKNVEYYRRKYLEATKINRPLKNCKDTTIYLTQKNISCDSLVKADSIALFTCGEENKLLTDQNTTLKDALAQSQSLNADQTALTDNQKEELKKAKRKEKWRKVFSTLKTIGVGVVAFFVGHSI